ncbi:hypothetical protein GSI_09965 [Ganoderma sinense ZZ0214-1]|uniref:F-box domain-containing protein n=1 Tax=Ganoderma sinense ZZ0214-1 TaxID=1077348 RepID=A0A2G8S2C8_9APHY|nr:hypothetical protein GSI_09965 [Ganoderma sinense ZZ0214-1]
MSRLNLDVLCSVCSFITDVPDILAFSLTCSTLRPPAIRRRLGMRPVVITDAMSINTLHAFIFVDKAGRSPHIRAITIPQEAGPLLKGCPEDLLHRLLAILSAATCVRTLSLHLPSRSSSSLLAHPLIVPAVARLTGVEDLALVSSFERANALLRCIRSPLKVFRYGSLYDDLSALRNTSLIGSSMRLSSIRRRIAMRQEMDEEFTIEVANHLSDTLSDLELPQVCLPRQPFLRLHPGPFLAVRSFVLRCVTEPLRLDVLLHILPNLDSSLVVEALPLFYNSMRDWQRVETIQEANRFAQERHAWKKLDRVVASPLMLFALGLTCPIRRLTLDLSADENSPSESADAFARHALGSVLRDHAPAHLTIRGLRLPAGLEHLDDLFSTNNALAGMTHLVVNAEYNSVDDGGKLLWPEEALDTLLARIQYSSLTHVHIEITAIIREADPFSGSVYHGIRDLPLERLATQFQLAVPSLYHISVTSRGAVLQSDKELQEVWNLPPRLSLENISRS